jgi:hypothetical protein
MVSGLIEIAIDFLDSAVRATKTIRKRCSLFEASSLPRANSTGVVAVVTGTVGTATEQIDLTPTTYRNASGEFVDFSQYNPDRIVLQAQGPNVVSLTDNDIGAFNLRSSNGSIAITSWGPGFAGSGMSIAASGGTNSYAVVIYGES